MSAADFNTWCTDNDMGVHYGKTRSFVVGSKHMKSANDSISITINEHITESINAQNHLDTVNCLNVAVVITKIGRNEETVPYVASTKVAPDDSRICTLI